MFFIVWPKIGSDGEFDASETATAMEADAVGDLLAAR